MEHAAIVLGKGGQVVARVNRVTAGAGALITLQSYAATLPVQTATEAGERVTLARIARQVNRRLREYDREASEENNSTNHGSYRCYGIAPARYRPDGH